MQGVEPSACHPVLNRVLSEPELQQLFSTDHSVLPSRKGRHFTVPPRLSSLLSARPQKCAYTTIVCGLGGHPSRLAGFGARVARGL